jgi:myo-inositol-1(or 4)-monophosphatase
MHTTPAPASGKLQQVALRAARAAGRIHLWCLSRTKVTRKTNAIDLVTEADRESEQAIIRTLNRAFPNHAILAEESGANARTSEHRWLIDPLDCTTNFAHGFPQFCVSIAYERSGRLELAVVFDALKRELFVVARGRGAPLNGRPIHVSGTPSLESALLATAFPYDQRERRNFYLTFWEAFMMRTQGVRHTGSAVLDLCYVACGRVDAAVEIRAPAVGRRGGSADRPEAGGRATNLDGSTLDSRRARSWRAMASCIARCAIHAERVSRGGSAPSRWPRHTVTHPSPFGGKSLASTGHHGCG